MKKVGQLRRMWLDEIKDVLLGRGLEEAVHSARDRDK